VRGVSPQVQSRIRSLLQGSFTKETYNLIDPTIRSHPIRHKSVRMCNTNSLSLSTKCPVCFQFQGVSLLQGSFTKDTYNLIDPTIRSHPPIHHQQSLSLQRCPVCFQGFQINTQYNPNHKVSRSLTGSLSLQLCTPCAQPRNCETFGWSHEGVSLFLCNSYCPPPLGLLVSSIGLFCWFLL